MVGAARVVPITEKEASVQVRSARCTRQGGEICVRMFAFRSYHFEIGAVKPAVHKFPRFFAGISGLNLWHFRAVLVADWEAEFSTKMVRYWLYVWSLLGSQLGKTYVWDNWRVGIAWESLCVVHRTAAWMYGKGL